MSEGPLASEVVKARFPQWVVATHHYCGDDTVIGAREGMLEVFRFLRDDSATAFNVLMDLSGVDYLTFGKRLESAPTLRTPSPLPYFMTPKPSIEQWERPAEASHRFEVVYHLYSLTHNRRLRVKIPVTAEDPTVDSVSGLWAVANWFEREVWDMFGIRFAGHPDPKRILMYEPFEGHPLRKDYPVDKRQPLIGPVN